MRARMLTLILQGISQPAMGPNGIFVIANGAELGPKRLDVRVYGAIQGGVGFFPGQFHELVPRINAARFLNEDLEKPKLVARKLQRTAAVTDLATLFINRKQFGCLRLYGTSALGAAQ